MSCHKSGVLSVFIHNISCASAGFNVISSQMSQIYVSGLGKQIAAIFIWVVSREPAVSYYFIRKMLGVGEFEALKEGLQASSLKQCTVLLPDFFLYHYRLILHFSIMWKLEFCE